MPTSHSKLVTVLANEFDISSRVSQAALSRDTATAAITGFGVDDEELIAGQQSAGLSLQGAWDDGASGPETVLEPLIGSTVIWTVVWNGGDASGDIGNRCGLVQTVNTYSPRATANDAVRYASGGDSTDRARFAGRLLHPLTSESGTGNYASSDNGASTALGGIGHLHVISFSGTSALIRIQDSANDSTWADLATFTSVTGVTSEAISWTGTTDRYLRAQIVSGTFSEITFAVSAARNRQ